jgi:hypothetical protein
MIFSTQIKYQASLMVVCKKTYFQSFWSVVAEWLGRRTLNQRVVGSIPGEGTARYRICEQDTLKSTARGSQNKQNCLRHIPLTSVKKEKKKVFALHNEIE